MASGHVYRTKGRTHGCSDQPCSVKLLLANPGARHTWPIAPVGARGEMSAKFRVNRKRQAVG